ncbi:MFS transporter [Micromonospora echinospora]|uniref:MFS transporter, DHA2 family, multidrug resistance protein n=1 Tax=Micromonospora echinospora TaxID=1877 RepID=A0A1C4Z2Z2_MICEC|nr:MFS transporter [Micromonospora echinospora]OZV77533.1 MFS transporter [Micromonospora echinospora]SCF27392.1 MFS transporter, DHA2 family, multidrug resistance protein [Micromonospora echinospora]
MTSTTPSPSVGATPDTPHRPVRAGARQWAALGALTLAVTLLAVDGTVLALAMPALTADLGATSTEVLWIGDAYSFALAGLLISMGTLADRIGRRRLLLIGVAGFGSASLVAAFAPTAGWLIAARVLLGVAGATLMPSTLSIVRNVFTDPAQRTRAIAVWSAGASGGAALGPLVGGVLLEHYWWGSVFVINLPIMLLVLISVALLVPESRNPAAARFDLVSAVLSVAAIVPLVWAVKHTAKSGIDPAGLLAAALSVGAALVFVRRQRTLRTPLVDVTLFARPAFTGTILVSLITIFAFSGLLFFFSQYLQLVRGHSPLEAGLRELPATLASIAVVVVAVRIIARLGVGRALAASLLVAAAGLGVLAITEGASGYAGLAAGLILVGLGIGMAFTASTDAILSAVPRERAGAASAISEMSYELGVALGIALLGTLHMALYRAGLPDLSGLAVPAREAVTDSLAAGTQALAGTGEQGAQVLAAARDAFAHGMQITSVIAAVLLVVAALIAWKVIPSGRRS